MHPIALRPERDVTEGHDGRLCASSTEPWLSLDCFDGGWRNRFIEVVYRSSWLDEPARPVFRFRLDDGSWLDRIGAAATLATGIWIGRVPRATVSLSISPTNRTGRFDFRIERITVQSWSTLIAVALARRSSYAWRALALRMIGCPAESDVMLDWSLSATDLDDLAIWRRRRHRPFDRAGIDHPRCDWSREKVILVVRPGAETKACIRTQASLLAQVFDSWSAILLHDKIDDLADLRFECCDIAELLNRSKDWSDDALICVLTAGDMLVPEALAYVVEQANRNPDGQIFFGDLLATGDDGIETPVFFPSWSPRHADRADGLGHPIFVRSRALRLILANERFFTTGVLPDTVLSTGVTVLRRILASTASAHAASPRPKSDPADAPPIGHPSGPSATIIIPTCNNPAMLERLLASILARSIQGLAEILIVDNGTRRGGAESAVAQHRSKARITVVEFKEAFNFSTICNLGASASQSEVLVFLNDDMEVLSADWLDRLVAHAAASDVGAVGAKLTYPDGRLQHVGMVVGMGESAGHFGAREKGDSPGWMRRNEVVHEVSAVTGACLAVQRRKFEDVGGFDSRHYPIELGDVDLCLRLRECGWRTLLDPHVHIMHFESKSRGRATFRRLDVHAAERTHFREKWIHVLRDDPHFHPGLSLYDWRPALG